MLNNIQKEMLYDISSLLKQIMRDKGLKTIQVIQVPFFTVVQTLSHWKPLNVKYSNHLWEMGMFCRHRKLP